MASVSQVPRESFRALAERTRYQRKKVIIVEGIDDCNVCHHHLTDAEKLLIFCKEIKTVNMPNAGRGNVATIISNADYIKEVSHISAIIDSDINVYDGHDEFVARNQSFCLFSSSGYSIENYALIEPDEIYHHFGDLFLPGADVGKWNEAIRISIKCFHILSLSYYLFSERNGVNYHLVRAAGGEYFNTIIRNNVTTDKYLETLNNILVQNSIPTHLYEELKSRGCQNAMKIDGKLVSNCIKLALFSCGCDLNNFSGNEIRRRLVHMIGAGKYSSNLSSAIDSLLVENNS